MLSVGRFIRFGLSATPIHSCFVLKLFSRTSPPSPPSAPPIAFVSYRDDWLRMSFSFLFLWSILYTDSRLCRRSIKYTQHRPLQPAHNTLCFVGFFHMDNPNLFVAVVVRRRTSRSYWMTSNRLLRTIHCCVSVAQLLFEIYLWCYISLALSLARARCLHSVVFFTLSLLLSSLSLFSFVFFFLFRRENTKMFSQFFVFLRFSLIFHQRISVRVRFHCLSRDE